MSFPTTLSLQLTLINGDEPEYLMSLGEEDCGFYCARELIERIGEWQIITARLGFVEPGGTITPWLTELELLDTEEVPF